MPDVISTGSHLPSWGKSQRAAVGDDEDAGRQAVEAGRVARSSADPVDRVVLVNRDLPHPECRNAAVPLASLGLELEVSGRALSTAGMTPAGMDVAEVHDFFTGIELISYEDLGFTERFGGYKLLEAEETTIGGGLPANTGGGLTAKTHPPGATGVAQCVELFERLRDEAVNQVNGARIGLAHNLGGPTAVSAVAILEGPVACGG